MKELSTSFQTKDKEIIESFEVVNEKLKDLSSHRKTSVAQTCYFALILARERIENIENRIEAHQNVINQRENNIKSIEKDFKNKADF